MGQLDRLHRIQGDRITRASAANPIGRAWGVRDLVKGTDPRVVVVTSGLYPFGRLDLADPAASRRFSPGVAYVNSTLANALFGVELDRRLRVADGPVRPVRRRWPAWDPPDRLTFDSF